MLKAFPQNNIAVFRPTPAARAVLSIRVQETFLAKFGAMVDVLRE